MLDGDGPREEFNFPPPVVPRAHKFDGATTQHHPVGTFSLPHVHVIRDGWPLSEKQALANHIDEWHK